MRESRMSKRSILLVHGAWHGGWTWRPLLPHLHEAGFDPFVVDLPSAGAGGDLAADVRVVQQALAALPGPTIVVGHSYGGVVISEACAEQPVVSHLVYLCAFQLDVGESLMGMLNGKPLPWIAVDEATGLCTVPEPTPVFYADVAPPLAAEFGARLRSQSLVSFMTSLTQAAWRAIPSTYIACTEDRAIPYPAQQAMAARARTVHTLRSSHSPFASQPAEVARILAGID